MSAVTRLLHTSWGQRGLLKTLIAKDIASTYARTVLGLFWILLLPLFFISVFTFVRLVLLGGAYEQWLGDTGGETSLADVALAIYAGLIAFWIASECWNKAPGLVQKNSVYIRDLRFPVELLVLQELGVSLFYTLVRTLLLVLGLLLLTDRMGWTIILAPVVLLPLVVVVVGGSYLLAAAGAFLRDLDMIVGVLMTGLLFLSGVIYPLSAIPPAYRSWMLANPLALTIRELRDVLLWGKLPDFDLLALLLVAGLLLLWGGYGLFERLKGRFADVV